MRSEHICEPSREWYGLIFVATERCRRNCTYGYIESFFAKLRDECLNREVFRNGREVQAIVENWRQEYNNYRPHSSLDYLTPAEFARRYYKKNQVTEAKQLVEKAGSLSL